MKNKTLTRLVAIINWILSKPTDPIPENYWRELAEERRLSLAEALAENEMVRNLQFGVLNYRDIGCSYTQQDILHRNGLFSQEHIENAPGFSPVV